MRHKWSQIEFVFPLCFQTVGSVGYFANFNIFLHMTSPDQRANMPGRRFGPGEFRESFGVDPPARRVSSIQEVDDSFMIQSYFFEKV